MRALLIEDDATVAQSMKLILEMEGHSVFQTGLGEEGQDLARIHDYDIILLDLNLPDVSGYDVLCVLRTAKITTPVLILSGMADIQDKVRGLGLGADDYLTKPFHKDELLARINAILRRSKTKVQSIITTGDLIVDLDAKSATLGAVHLSLTSKEYQILELLALRKGTILTKDNFLTYLYSGMDEPDVKIIDVFICKLRKKLIGASGGKEYIETVWGRGYVLREPADQLNAS